jgi:fructose-specific PTS system IIA-like component
MGAQASCLPLLVGLGLDEISASTTAVIALKTELAAWPVTACRKLVAEALNCTQADEVHALIEQYRTKRPLPLVDPALVLLDADCASKEAAIDQAVNLLYVLGRTEQPHALEQAVWQRETTYSTGFGHGFAIPHCKSDAVSANSLVILKLRTPVEWKSLDHQPVGLVILMVIRAGDHAQSHMKIFSRLARKVMDETFRERLLVEQDAGALCAFLHETLNI